MANTFPCKHSKREVYLDPKSDKYFAECEVCGSQGKLDEDPKEATKHLLKIKAQRPSRMGGARDGAGRPKELSEDVKYRGFMLGDDHIEAIDKFNEVYRKLSGEDMQGGRSGGLRFLFERMRVKDMKAIITH